MTEFRERDLTGAQVRGALFNGSRLRGVGDPGAAVGGHRRTGAVRRERQAMVRHVMESLTDERLGSEVTRTGPGWPRETVPGKECPHIVLNEEWEHRLCAERDLTVLEKEN